MLWLEAGGGAEGWSCGGSRHGDHSSYVGVVERAQMRMRWESVAQNGYNLHDYRNLSERVADLEWGGASNHQSMPRLVVRMLGWKERR